MGVINIKVNGLDAVLSKITAKTNAIEKGIQGELDGWAIDTVALAKQNAPTNEGHLKGAISPEYGKLRASVTVAVDYAAYVEFGTRKYGSAYVATLPPDWKSFAATFKGKGSGSFEEFVQNIMEWVQRKGIGALKTKSGNKSGSKESLDAMQSAAYAIAINIIQNGIKPHPYLYPAWQKTKPELIENIKALLK